MRKFDLIILGGGALGIGAAMKANDLNAKISIINDTGKEIMCRCNTVPK